MKNKKEFFGVLISVLVCVFIVSLFVYAITTVSEDIDIATGNLVVGHDAIMEHALQVGHDSSASYSRFGDGTTGHGLTDDDDVLFVGLVEFDDAAYFDGNVSVSHDNWLRVPYIYGNMDSGQYLRIGDDGTAGHVDAEDDLLVSGELEVDGVAYFDNTVSVSSSGLLLDGGATITTGVTSPGASCVVGSLYIDSAGAVGAVLHICDEADTWTLISTD